MAMNLTHLIQPAAAKNIDVAAPKVESVSKPAKTEQSNSKFDDYLTDASQTAPANEATTKTAEVVKEVEQVVASDTLEEVSDVLELPIDEHTLMVPIGPDGELVPIDELMNLEDLSALLNIDLAELEDILSQLLNEEVMLENVWDLITLVEDHAPELMAQLTAALQGELNVTPKEAAQVVNLLKLIETMGQKTDLTAPQQQQLQTVKDMLQTLVQEVKPLATAAPKQQAAPLQTFQQVFTKVVVPEAVKTEQTVEQPVAPVTTQAPVKAQPLTITLPATNPSAQSEALAKEIQAIIQRQQIANQQGTLKLAIKLYPENLGTIRLELMHKDGMLTARLMASTASGKELLDAQLHQLKQGLTAQNIQVERIEITQSLQDPTRNLNNSDQHLFNNFFQRQQKDDEEETDGTDEEQASFSDFLAQMEEVEI